MVAYQGRLSLASALLPRYTSPMPSTAGGEAKAGQTIVLCGPFSGKGGKILRGLAYFLREYDFSAYTVDELYPVPQRRRYTPEQARDASYRALRDAAAALFVFLSAPTLGVEPGERDLCGGAGFEFGLIYEAVRGSGRPFYAAFLFDGEGCRAQISTLLRGQWQGKDLEYTMNNPGDPEELANAAFLLCQSLEARLDI